MNPVRLRSSHLRLRVISESLQSRRSERLFIHSDSSVILCVCYQRPKHLTHTHTERRFVFHTLLMCSCVLLSLCSSGVSVTILKPRPLLSSKSRLYLT